MSLVFGATDQYPTMLASRLIAGTAAAAIWSGALLWLDRDHSDVARGFWGPVLALLADACDLERVRRPAAPCLALLAGTAGIVICSAGSGLIAQPNTQPWRSACWSRCCVRGCGCRRESWLA